jgi:putative ABC transport system permease protein
MAWFHRLANVFRPEALRSEIDEELRHHIEARTAGNIAAGMSRQEARADALRRFGGPTLALDKAHDADTFTWLETILQDFRYGFRSMRSSPFVTGVLLFSLALAIGAGTAIFSVVDTVLLRALPYKDPDRIALLWMTNTLRGDLLTVTIPNFDDWKRRNRIFENLALYREADGSFSVNDEPGWIEFAWVYGDYFRVLGRSPIIGQTFSANPGDPHQVVLSFRLWRSRFGGSADIIGRTLQVSGIDFQVIGVMPEDFAFPSKDTQLWAPAEAVPNWHTRRQDRRTGSGTVIGRLRQGASVDQARAEMQSITGQLVAEYPEANEGRASAVSIVPLATQIHGRTVPFMLAILAGAVLLVLLIACANAANLLLARGAVRRREIALRTALGAGRGRILRQLITESILLSFLAGILGVPFAAWGIRALIALAPPGIARLDEAHLDIRVLAFSLGLSLVTGVLFGIAPAIRISQGVDSRRQTAGVESRGMRRAFVLAEIAVAVVLLTGAGLLVRSLLALQSVDPGFQTSRVLTGRLRFPNTLPRDHRAALYREAMTRIGQAPGVSAVGSVSTMFYGGDEARFGLRAVEGRPPESREQWKPMTWSTVSGDYFAALGVPLMRGRFFNDSDTKNSTPVVIINETMARRYWPGEDPIGKGIKGFDPRGVNDEWVRVIGVVKDMRSRGLERTPMAQIYQAQAQSLDETQDLVVRTDATAGMLRSIIRSVDQTAVLTDVTTLDARLREQNAPRRFQTLLLTTFAAVALALAAAGIFAMMHYSVAQRTQEIGIRMALGARQSQVVRMVLREGLLLVGAGIGMGLVGSLALTRVIRTLLFEVGPGDPITLGAVALLLTSTGILACYFPAHRATRVNPMLALRCD